MFNLYKLRDNFWNYPYAIFFGDSSLLGRLRHAYDAARPFSHIIATSLVTILLFVTISANVQNILGFNRDTFVEGIIVGTNDNNNQLRGPENLNPLYINSRNTQLENDIMALIYQPLIRVEFKPGSFEPEVIPVLAENYAQNKQNGDTYYRFNLRKDVKWHDGYSFTADDVIATFNLIKELAASNQPDIYGANIAEDVTVTKLDDHICEFKVSGKTIPNFYELISFKIVAINHLDQLKEAIVSGQYKGKFLLSTIGTGPYQLAQVGEKEITLRANNSYYLGLPKIKEVKLRLLTDYTEAVAAVRSGLIHAITNIDSTAITEVTQQPNFELQSSPVIYTQYWGMYYNLSQDGPGALKDVAVRKAINLAIDKELEVKSIFPKGEVARGTIPRVSAFFNEGYSQPQFDSNLAKQTLENAGWQISSETDEQGNALQVRKKQDQLLTFNLVFADSKDNTDRFKIASAIKRDLAAIGVHAILQGRDPREMTDIRANYDFDLLLFGVSTFVDPDRLEFFSSDQAFDPENTESDASGLNIAAYSSTAQESIVDPETRRVVRVPAANRLLEEARQEEDAGARKKLYDRFQKLLFDDVPVAFLYHPTLRYVVNKRIRNVDLTGAKFIEDRFNNIHNWQIDF